MIILREKRRFGLSDFAADQAALPYTHQPDQVKAEARKLVPIAIRDIREGQFASIAPGKGFQPHPCIDFIEVRMGAQRELLNLTGWAVHGIREG